ncbi:MAG: aldolase/citrate lyase family protein [Myxococcota bacterium]|nr:aldolase/citrate lyase family protein [Myxococcota bacterium]
MTTTETATSTSLRTKLRTAACVGSFVSLKDPFVVGQLSVAGYDFVLIDMEHFPCSPETLQAMVTTAKSVDMGVMVRVADSSRSSIQQALDTGADGILVPMVESVQQAKAIVDLAHHAPLGSRGFHSMTNAAAYGAVSPDELSYYTSQRIVVGIQIETRLGLQACEAMSALRGIDLVFAGPGDLAQSLGVDPRSDMLEHAVKRIIGAARSHGKFAGIFALAANQVRGASAMGARFLVVASDTLFLRQAAEAMRSELGSLPDPGALTPRPFKLVRHPERLRKRPSRLVRRAG